MNRWHRIESLFDRVAELPEEEQRIALHEACGDDEELFREVRTLLDTDRSAGALFETPALELEARRLARSAELAPGSRLGDYRIEALIDAGGSATVYRATNLMTGRPAALKVFLNGPEFNRTQRRRFEREIRAIAAIDDPRVPKLYGSGEEKGLRYLAEEYAEGRTIRERMQQHPFRQEEILDLARQIAEVLSLAHRRGIVHRDIKPENLMISDSGRLKILDFGIVKFRRSFGTPNELDSCASTLTQQGTIIGTFDYMSPEQLMGEPVDHRSDLFSLGLLLYELATGRNPFESPSFPQKVALLAEWNLPPAARMVPALDPHLGKVIDRCLRRRPEERYQSAEELLGDLKREAGSSPGDEQMRNEHRVLLMIDSLVNLIVGALLLFSPLGLLAWLGLPTADSYFYASILGAVIFGIGLSLLLELRGAPRRFRGLGPGGAIAINLSGGGALLVWLVAAPLSIPLRGHIILWSVALVVLIIGIVELATKSWKYE